MSIKDIQLRVVLLSQLDEMWPSIQHAASFAIPAEKQTPEVWERLFTSFRTGQLVAVGITGTVEKEEGTEANSVLGLLIIQPQRDAVLNEGVLHIWSMYGAKQLTHEVYEQALAKLHGFAKTLNCSAITAVSDVSFIIMMAKKLGGTEGPNKQFIRLEVR